MDMSTLSDEQLNALANAKPGGASAGLDVSKLSDEQLHALANHDVGSTAPQKEEGQSNWDRMLHPTESQRATDKQSTIDAGNRQGEISKTGLNAQLNAMTLNYLPQIKAKGGQLLSGEGLANDDKYLARRDSEIADEQRLAEKYPTADLTGKVSGYAMPMAASMGMAAPEALGSEIAGEVAKQGLLRRAAAQGLKGAVTGGALGAAANPGDTAGKLDPFQIDDRIKNAVSGAEWGGALGAAGPVLGATARTVGEKAKDIAESQAFRSMGGALKDIRALGIKKAKELGRYGLDNKIVQGLSSVDDIADRAVKSRNAAGETLDQVYNQANEKFGDILDEASFDPKRDKGLILAAAQKELGDTEGANAAVQKLSNYLDEVAERHGDRPNDVARANYKKELEAYLPKMKQYQQQAAEYEQAYGQAGANSKQPVLSGFADDLQRTEDAPMQVEVHGKPSAQARVQPEPPLMTQDHLPDLPTSETAVSRLMGREGEPTFNGINQGAIDRTPGKTGERLAQEDQREFLHQHTADQLNLFGKQGQFENLDVTPREKVTVSGKKITQGSGQITSHAFPEEPTAPVEPNEIRNPMDPRRANNIKTAMDRTINYSRNPMQPDPAKEVAFRAGRKFLAAKVDDAIEQLGGDERLAALKKANREYGNSNQIASMSVDRVNRNAANKMFGLGDHMIGSAVAGGEMAAGHPAGALLGAVAATANKLVTKYGNSTMAVGFDRLSKMLLRSPEFQRIAEQNPKVFQATVVNLLSHLENKGVFEALPAAAGNNELDNDSSRSSNYNDQKQGDDMKSQPKPSPTPKPKKGPDKWASDGADNIAAHEPDHGLDVDAAMQDPKSKALLIAASDMKPKSKAMAEILSKLKSKQVRN